MSPAVKPDAGLMMPRALTGTSFCGRDMYLQVNLTVRPMTIIVTKDSIGPSSTTEVRHDSESYNSMCRAAETTARKNIFCVFEAHPQCWLLEHLTEDISIDARR